jgi:hypothetical protein
MSVAKLCLVLIFSWSFAPTQIAAASEPDEKFFGPGDRPSVCLERARDGITRNLISMTKIAKALQRSKSIDEVGFLHYSDGNSEVVFMADGVQIEQTDKTTAAFKTLFDELPGNFFTPWHFIENKEVVIARPGAYNPGLFILKSGPWCGGSDEDWKAELSKEFYVGVDSGGPLFYAYDANGITLQRPCSDEEFLSSSNGYCDLSLSKNWAVVFQYSTRVGIE